MLEYFVWGDFGHAVWWLFGILEAKIEIGATGVLPGADDDMVLANRAPASGVCWTMQRDCGRAEKGCDMHYAGVNRHDGRGV